MNYRDKTKDELINKLQKLQSEYDSLKKSYKKDITRRKRAEEELKEKNDRLNVIASSTPDHTLVQDNELRYTLVINPQLGLTEQDMLGKTDYDFLSKEEADKLTGVKRHVIETGEPQHFETSLISKDGKPEFFDGTYIPRFNAQGNADGLIGYFRNVTEAKLVEDSLRESEDRYRLLVEGSPDAIAIHSKGKFVFVNPTGAKLVGAQSPQELIGSPILDVVHPDSRSKVVDRIRLVAEGKEAPLFEEKFVKFDGSVIDVEVVGIPYPYQGQIATQVIVSDITERKQVEDALKKSEALFREIYDNMKSGSVIFTVINDGSKGSDYIIKKFNRSGLKMEGKALEEVIGKRFIDIRPTIDSYGLIPIMKKVWETGESAFLPTRIYIDERHSHYYENYVFKLPSGEVVTLYDDVTESKRAEEEIRILARFPSENPDPVLRVDRSGLLLYANEACNKLLTWKLQIGKKAPSVLQKTITDSLMDGIRKKIEMDHNNHIFSFNIIPVMEEGYANLYCRDITERKQAEKELRESEIRYHELFNNISSGVAIYEVIGNGDDFVFRDFNQAGQRIDGDQKEDIIGKSIYQVRPGIIKFGLLEVFKRVFVTGIPEHYPVRFYDDEKLHGWYDNFIYRLPSGEIVAVYDDITTSKQAEEALFLEKENFRHSLDDSPLGVRIATVEGNTIYANKTLLNFYGYDSLEELQKTSLKDRYTPESYAQAEERKLQRERGDFSTTDYEISIVRENGEIRHLQVFRKEVLWNGVSQFQIMYYEITKRKKAEEEVIKSKKLLENLYKHLNETRENERASISREIHDQIGQSLTALKLDLNQMHKYINADPEAEAKLGSMVELISDTIKDVQRISSDLRPGILDELGLVSAIEWYCDEFEKRTGIKCNMKLDDSDFSDSQINLTFFRVLQETLTNVIRHARASSVRIKLHKLKKGVTMTIQDNGIGIPEEMVGSTKSLGLISMHERAKQFNGTIDISSKEGNGTKLIIFIPS